MLSRFFINRPIFATVLSILIVVAGVITLRSLPVEQYPTITPPTVVVEAQYPGANATTIAQMVATRSSNKLTGSKECFICHPLLPVLGSIGLP